MVNGYNKELEEGAKLAWRVRRIVVTRRHILRSTGWPQLIPAAANYVFCLTRPVETVLSVYPFTPPCLPGRCPTHSSRSGIQYYIVEFPYWGGRATRIGPIKMKQIAHLTTNKWKTMVIMLVSVNNILLMLVSRHAIGGCVKLLISINSIGKV